MSATISPSGLTPTAYTSFTMPSADSVAWIVIAFGVVLRVPLLFTPLTYLSDVWRQADTASIAHHFLVNRFRLFHPQIYWGGSGPGYVETEFQLYPFLVALLYRAFGEHLWLGRLVSLFFAIPTFIVFHLLARRVLLQGAVWATIFLVLSPLDVRYSVAFMPESTVLCLYMVSLYLFQIWLAEQRLSTLMLAAASTALAILVKPTSIHVGLIFALLLVGRFGIAAFRRWDVWLFGVLCLLPAIPWYIHARNLYLTYGNTFGLFSGGDSKFGSLYDWLSLGFYQKLAGLEVAWVLTDVGAFFFAAGLLLSIKRKRPLFLPFGTVTIAIYYMIVARYAQQSWGIQYHIFALPFAAIGIGLFCERLLSVRVRLAGPIILAMAFCAITAQAGLVYLQMLRTGQNQQIECAKKVERVVPEGALIVSVTTELSRDPGRGVPNNYQDPVLFFYSHRHGFSLPADRYSVANLEKLRREGAAYVIITSERLYRGNIGSVRYLDEHAAQIGPGIGAGCAIYRLELDARHER